nr:Uncharacterised protein [Raoultella sp. NCTC 9187]
MTLRAETQLAEAGLPLNMELKSKQLYWPFSGEKQFQADDLQLTFSGKMTDYALAMSTAVKGQSLPPAKISLNAKGNEQQVNIDKLTVAALEGKTELKALLDWQQAISWRGELTLDGIKHRQRGSGLAFEAQRSDQNPGQPLRRQLADVGAGAENHR